MVSLEAKINLLDAKDVLTAKAKVSTFSQLCDFLRSSPVALITFCDAEKIVLENSFFDTTTRYPKRDAMIIAGATLGEMNKSFAISRAGIHHYIILSGQYGHWRKAVIEKQKLSEDYLHKKRELFVNNLVQLLYQKASRGSFVEQMAYQYRVINPSTSISFEQLIRIYNAYEQLNKPNQHPSSVALSKHAEISYKTCLKAIRLVGLQCEREIKPRKRILGYRTQAISRAINLGLSNKDIAYFLAIPLGTVPYYVKTFEKSHIETLFISKKRQINYSMASIVYEFLDGGLTRTEISEGCNFNKKRVIYLQQNRNWIESKIISVLQQLYDNPHLEKPYRITLKN